MRTPKKANATRERGESKKENTTTTNTTSNGFDSQLNPLIKKLVIAFEARDFSKVSIAELLEALNNDYLKEDTFNRLVSSRGTL